MTRTALVLLLCLWNPLFGAAPVLPPGAIPLLIELDDSGNGYIAGTLPKETLPAAPDDLDSFLLKYRLGTGEAVYFKRITSAGYHPVNGIAVDGAGSLYFTGSASPGAAIGGVAMQALAAAETGSILVGKLNASGGVAYATLLGPAGFSAGIAVNAMGEAHITGSVNNQGSLPATPGAAVNRETAALRNFVVKVDAAGSRILLVERGIGGRHIALDAAGNIYVSGTSANNGEPPVTPGAFQRTHEERSCGGPGGFLGYFPCFYLHVAKLDSTGATLLYSTFLNGAMGAQPAGLSVDGEGNAIVAGSTMSEDFPTTEGVVVPRYRASHPPRSPAYPGRFPPLEVPAVSGFIAKLNASGSGLVFSTYFSGTLTDSISGMRLHNGSIYLTGGIGSADLPGASTIVQQCLTLQRGFVTRLSGDGRSVGNTYILPDTGTQSLAVDRNGQIYTGGLETISLDSPPPPIHCLADAASLRLLQTVAPGQILSLFGPGLAPRTEAAGTRPGETFPNFLGGFTIAFDGVPAKLLYASPAQVNLVTPFEIAEKGEVDMTYGPEGVHWVDMLPRIKLTVTPRAPAAFEAWKPVDYCGRSDQSLLWPVAFAHNADGSVNSCSNPARSGSTITLFVNGGGIAPETPENGVIAAEFTRLTSVPLSVTGQAAEISLDRGSPVSVWRITVRVPAVSGTTARTFAITVGGVPIAQQEIAVWLAP